MMKRRGKVLRDTSAGPGLLIAEGQQYPFPLEGVWQSETPPRPGLVVDVDLNEDGIVKSVTAVSESQIAKEQAEQALAAARAKGGALASTAVARFGMPTLVATGLLIIGWFFLSTISINTGFLGKMDFTFWRVLSFVNAKNAFEALGTLKDGGSAGLYGLLAVITLVGPFLSTFWKDRRAVLGGLLPLLFMLLVALLVRSAISSATAGAPTEMMDAARSEIMKQVSIGMGAYVSLLAAIYLAFISVKKFLVAKATS
ncbi:MAG: hypothetical protein BGO25_09250 [Acidobacteriales bacterium 59-55]|nr:MAG: hypothetical protein BGO25_09250 [Acidobacteriales bacterium 59-55]